MYCGKCGTQVENTALFCPNCGERLEIEDVIVPMQSVVRRKKHGLMFGIAVSSFLAVILAILLLSGRGYKGTIDDYFEAHENKDADLMYNSVVAQYWIDSMNEDWGNSAYEMIETSIEDKIRDWDCGDNIEITYEILEEKRASKKELEDLEENIYDWHAYYVYDREDFSISDAYVLEIEFTVEGDEGTGTFYFTDGFLIIKENGEWRVPRGAINCSFYNNQ